MLETHCILGTLMKIRAHPSPFAALAYPHSKKVLIYCWVDKRVFLSLDGWQKLGGDLKTCMQLSAPQRSNSNSSTTTPFDVWNYSIVNTQVLCRNMRVNSNSTNVIEQLHIPCLHIMPFCCLTELDCRALDKREYLVIIRDNFCLFCTKSYIVTPHLNRLDETVQMRGHNIWFQ